VDQNFLELPDQGITPDGRLAFGYTDMETSSNETTMSRYGQRQSILIAFLTPIMSLFE
jgi:hypothetical protein